MSKSVYLAGPIAGLTYEEATVWRTVASAFLEGFDIVAYSPLRSKEFLDDHHIIGISRYSHVLAADAGIVARDRMDVMTCDLVLVNLLGITYCSVGTPVEYGWADAYRKPIITIMEPKGSPYDHPFIRQLTGFRVETLEEGLEIAVSILRGDR